MLNRFEISEEDLTQDDPRFRVMDAWASFDGTFRRNYRRVMGLIGDLNDVALFEGRNDQTFNYAAELEARLQTVCPEMIGAVDGLRTALDRVAGWHIAWRHYERGEAIGSEARLVDESIILSRIVRGPAQFHQNEGWVISSQVGADQVMGGLGVWLEIGHTADAAKGINHQLGEMFAIELTPPSA